jgi:hypothetical protein
MSKFSNFQNSNIKSHQTGNISCPHCQTMDQVKKVSAIHSAGISDLNLSGTSSGNVGYYASNSNIQLSGQNQTYLSQKLAPPGKAPEKPISANQLKIFSIVTAVPFVIVMFPIILQLIFGQDFIKAIMNSISDFIDIKGVGIIFFTSVTLLMFALPLLVILGSIFILQTNARRTYQSRLSYWRRACAVWNELFYCNRWGISLRRDRLHSGLFGDFRF